MLSVYTFLVSRSSSISKACSVDASGRCFRSRVAVGTVGTVIDPRFVRLNWTIHDVEVAHGTRLGVQEDVAMGKCGSCHVNKMDTNLAALPGGLRMLGTELAVRCDDAVIKLARVVMIATVPNDLHGVCVDMQRVCVGT